MRVAVCRLSPSYAPMLQHDRVDISWLYVSHVLLGCIMLVAGGR